MAASLNGSIGRPRPLQYSTTSAGTSLAPRMIPSEYRAAVLARFMPSAFSRRLNSSASAPPNLASSAKSAANGAVGVSS